MCQSFRKRACLIFGTRTIALDLAFEWATAIFECLQTGDGEHRRFWPFWLQPPSGLGGVQLGPSINDRQTNQIPCLKSLQAPGCRSLVRGGPGGSAKHHRRCRGDGWRAVKGLRVGLLRHAGGCGDGRPHPTASCAGPRTRPPPGRPVNTPVLDGASKTRHPSQTAVAVSSAPFPASSTRCRHPFRIRLLITAENGTVGVRHRRCVSGSRAPWPRPRPTRGQSDPFPPRVRTSGGAPDAASRLLYSVAPQNSAF